LGVVLHGDIIMFSKSIILKVGALAGATLFLALPAFADEDRDIDHVAKWYKPHPVVHAAPGPVAGVGLPLLAAAGGLVWLLRKKRVTPKEL
jgi:hypothetical protein